MGPYSQLCHYPFALQRFQCWGDIFMDRIYLSIFYIFLVYFPLGLLCYFYFPLWKVLSHSILCNLTSAFYMVNLPTIFKGLLILINLGRSNSCIFFLACWTRFFCSCMWRLMLSLSVRESTTNLVGSEFRIAMKVFHAGCNSINCQGVPGHPHPHPTPLYFVSLVILF